MKKTSWLCWLLALSMLCLQAEAQYKFRRPPLPPPQIFKKSWPPGPRMPPMGNSVHIGPNFPHKRPPLFKPPNYRFRRPPSPPAPPPSPMFNVLSNPYNKSPPLPSNLAIMSNFGSAGVPPPPAQRAPPPLPPPQPTPPKDFQSIGKVPQLFSPEYNRAEVVAAALQTHRAALDDDKGPIHTIPAPNLAPGANGKSYQQQHQQQQQANKPEETPRRPYSVTQVDYATVFNGQDTGILNQRLVPSSHSSSVPQHHQYEVTESNEVNSVPPSSYFTTDFDTAHYSTSIVHDQQANDVYASHPSSSGISRSTQQQQLDSSPSMQANLHSSMHVGGGSSAAQQQQQQHQQQHQQAQGAADLHVGQPVAAGPPMSAAKLYEVLNTFPAQLTEQYSLNQQPQIQQHLLQQQLSEILQGQQDDQSAAVRATFSQPTLHSFNYEEQGSKRQKQQQQNIYIDQNYASGRVTADYSLAPEASEISQQEVNVADPSEQEENNIEFESSLGFVKPTTYFSKSGGEQSVASQFYTTLPNRDAAEKLAALAAAGNVNSQLISQLRAKQQQQQQSKESQQPQSDQPMPANHKDEESEQSSADRFNERQRQKSFYARQKIREEQQARWQEEKDKFQQQSQDGQDNKPLRIFVPEDGSEKEREIAADDYEYESDEADVPRENEPSSEDTNFGSRIVSKN